MITDDPTAPAKKSHKKKPAPVATSDDCPTGSPMLGMKDPAVIAWHLDRHPDRMTEIYGSWDWQAYLSQQTAQENHE
jgi:hypothetical protein